MSLDFNRPEVLEPPSYPPRCCVQQTITVTEAVTAKTAQRHDYPSKAHRLFYARRTAAERTLSSSVSGTSSVFRTRLWLFGSLGLPNLLSEWEEESAIERRV